MFSAFYCIWIWIIIANLLTDISAMKCVAYGHDVADRWLLKDDTEANEVMESGNEFHSVIVLAAKDFWNWVKAQRGISSLCLVVDPLTGLSHRTRSSWFIGTATCSFRILDRKVNQLMRLRSSKGSRQSWCNRAVTLVPRSCLLVIQRAALLWTLSSASLSLIKWGSHIMLAAVSYCIVFISFLVCS